MRPPITEAVAAAYAREWVGAWNSHDPLRVLVHYADAVRWESPYVEALVPGSGGVLAGKDAVHRYILLALAAYPGLRFTLRGVFTGERSIVIEYDSIHGLIAAECLSFSYDGLVEAVRCHYRPGDLHAA